MGAGEGTYINGADYQSERARIAVMLALPSPEEENPISAYDICRQRGLHLRMKNEVENELERRVLVGFSHTDTDGVISILEKTKDNKYAYIPATFSEKLGVKFRTLLR